MYISNPKSQATPLIPADNPKRLRSRVDSRKTDKHPYTSIKPTKEAGLEKPATPSGALVKPNGQSAQVYAQNASLPTLAGAASANDLTLSGGSNRDAMLERMQSVIRGHLVEEEPPSRRAQRAISAYQTQQTFEERSHITHVMGIDDYA